MRSVIKKYTNGEITVFWKSVFCIHSGECFTNLPKVFKPSESPWIDMLAASTEDIMRVVDLCPTDALSYKHNKDLEDKHDSSSPISITNKPVEIKISKNGPIVIDGDVNIYDSNGNLIKQTNKTFLCRCGATNTSPFCDGTHIKTHFTDK
ncbi:MAG: hypothetical protein A2X12_02360 [Bacteroidetes bacterium GWE2_29_8]|nr:MAG: hypothetical protein A2X12_02360 [Bacteroidetes bacterium GWE2_29_8]OFY14609.1 MAG: hypothetical protein A2X02_05945 [Bacteroidetes bacterium GWF2_29_10]